MVAAFLDGTTKPAVSVSDGRSEAGGRDLDGTPLLSALRGIRVTVIAPRSDAAGATWEVAYGDKRLRLDGTDGRLTGTLRAQDLVGTPLQFVFHQTVGGHTTTHDRDGAPFALRADRDLPTATLEAPAASDHAAIPVRWTGADDVGVATYRVEVREGAGAWRTWLHATKETGATFTGEPGRTYRFRATATDLAGNEGAPSAERSVAIAAAAVADGPNAAPTVAFAGLDEGRTFAAPFTARVAADDPDGTTPQVRVCVWREDDVLDVACPHEGAPGAFTVDVAGLPDGRYRLHATATDGTLTSEADSPVFAVQRAPPAILGASADFDGTRGLLVLGAGPEVSAVEARVGDRVVPLRDDGRGGDPAARDGVWTASLRLDPGDYVARFVARTATGGSSETEAAFRVEPDPAPATTGGDDGGGAAPPASTPPPAKRTPGPGLALVLGALAAVAVALALRRRA